MACAICQTRRPRRFCPGVRGDICTICCGTEREVTVDCPLDCEYLLEAHQHEKPVPIDAAQIPNRDIRVSEEFLNQHDELVIFLGQAMLQGALKTHGAVDFDVREALAALVQTYRTLQSGVFYESVPTNPLAAKIFRAVQQAAAEFRREEVKDGGMARTRDADILGILVFLERLELDRNNGRRRGRAFLDLLRGLYPAEAGPVSPPPSSLLLP